LRSVLVVCLNNVLNYDKYIIFLFIGEKTLLSTNVFSAGIVAGAKFMVAT